MIGEERSRTLDELRQDIKDEAPYVDVRSHSHNIINLCLRMIAEDHGKEEANKAVRDFKLEQKGWTQQ